MSAPTPLRSAGTLDAGDCRAEFIRALLAWLNARYARDGVAIEAETPLFARRLIDSLRILELIAFTEHVLGVRIPDHAVRMDNFATAARIAEVFAVTPDRWPATEGGDDAIA